MTVRTKTAISLSDRRPRLSKIVEDLKQQHLGVQRHRRRQQEQQLRVRHLLIRLLQQLQLLQAQLFQQLQLQRQRQQLQLHLQLYRQQLQR